MKSFTCECGNRLFFRNTSCVRCERPLGYLPYIGRVVALAPSGEAGLWRWQDQCYRQCQNYAVENVCNWMVPAEDPNPFCWACRLNQIIPDLSRPKHCEYWYKIEAAKRHMLYTLYQLRLPVVSKQDDPEHGLAFTFLADRDSETEFSDPIHGQEAVFTGHDKGLVTINLAEADDVARTRAREMMHEQYRTLLGHFRHEIGHYYWDRLIRDVPERLGAYRKLFGDEQQDYQAALDRHYRDGPPPDWEKQFISSYAAMHPWEDWAECWAHYMHMVDSLETAQEFGLVPASADVGSGNGQGVGFNPSHEDFQHMLGRWVELTIAMNALSRSMGLSDIYPFVLPKAAERKLEFIHRLIAGLNHHA